MLYRAKSYAKAAIALDASAALGNDGTSIEDRFHAARARSRAGDDAAAIPLYDKLALEAPGAKWGAEAGFLAANLRFQHGDWKAAIAAFEVYLKKSSKVDGQESNAREARRARAIALMLDGNLTAAHALDVIAKGDDYEKDAYGAARIDLLRAIAAQRAGESSEAIVRLQALRARFPYGWFDLVGRVRLAKLGVATAPWPAGPVAPLVPASMPTEIDPLFAAGLSRDARDAWAKPQGDDALVCATYEALDAGWDAYRVGMKLDTSQPPDTSSWRWRCAFPTPFDEVVRALEIRENLPRGTMHAVLRQESGFRIEVVSPAGAVGIAQLMPTTAATTAKACGMTIDPDDVVALESPYLQLDLSARHMHALFDQFGGPNAPRAAPLVIAAYNAGAGAVKRWLGEAGTLEADLWVERIPFVETRAYTARVTGNLVRYSILAGVAPPTLPTTFE
jgi:soluble lytic murein transglycosylase